MSDRNEQPDRRRGNRKVIMTAVVLGLVAVGFYVAAIITQVVTR